MSLFSRKPQAKVSIRTTIQAPAPVEAFVLVPMELMDRYYDRSAGRWCDGCKANGSHHTDQHNDFARAVLSFVTPTPVN